MRRACGRKHPHPVDVRAASGLLLNAHCGILFTVVRFPTGPITGICAVQDTCVVARM
jgi:hypothetical protein